MTNPNVTAPLTDVARQHFITKAEELASKGLRIIALAHRLMDRASVQDIAREDAEKDATFLGLVGIFDPPRPESLGAVLACKEAGIVVHMCVSLDCKLHLAWLAYTCARLTGDHAATAKAIAGSVGILTPDYPPSAVVTVSLELSFKQLHSPSIVD